MAVMDPEISDALYIGACADRPDNPDSKPTPGDRSITRFRNRVVAFLREVPEDVTAGDLLREIDPPQDDQTSASDEDGA